MEAFMKDMPVLGNFKVCKKCGGKFYLPFGTPWPWKTNYRGRNYIFCSYKCKRKFDKGIK
nr:MAG TPA: protein of unknown function (DUF3330) [Caudoviricetes sp.]